MLPILPAILVGECDAPSAAPSAVWLLPRTGASDRGHASFCRIAARLLNIHITQIQLSHDPVGRPVLEDPATHRRHPLEISIAHCASVNVMAACRIGRIGVDVELDRPLPGDIDSMALQYLTLAERQHLQTAKLHQRHREFLRIWTLKEACLKAIGLGLAIEPREIQTPPPDAGPPVPESVQLLRAPGNSSWLGHHLRIEAFGQALLVSVAWEPTGPLV